MEEQVFLYFGWGDISEVVYICLYQLYTNNRRTPDHQMC